MGRAYQNRKESMAKTSDAKARVYSKYGREIYVTAKAGGVDPAGNLSLRSVIDRAKKDQVPTHVIDKAIEKAKGGAGENFEVARYEGYGPGNCMVIIDCLTDNPSRTFNDVRLCFTKTKTKIGTQGSVSHMFDHLCILKFSGMDEEAVLDALLMADVDVVDIENEADNLTVFAPHTESFKAKTALSEAFGDIDYDVDEIQFIAQNLSPLSGEDVELFETFVDMLNDLDDVQNIYHNVE
ncbi:YebC/PmpR family DNA-binding transcriptional regulator [Porticoccaceae bacterium]|nr:YebC/PmpR family DNA-binding transcriptional regulator [Porticoccaceae bacterium]MDC0494719.1 YebC/PmpR family DNA-binding transcriptional regulator [bacterium]MDA8651303.1 YebC/PmpR family DNA-binding transcriptional regulator [Porticoccaceae bacterium]MDA8682550.1 YebC/PmpR family DNA-binding transcriptional regulator [Porticoccaceae bacterium]MDA8788904.1 YebC/PmpR family DNA-binding transcriptional regulator [Porticoccaceae bacterium]